MIFSGARINVTIFQTLSITLSLLLWSSSAQDGGWKSVQFDPKYIPYSELLTTPITHPGLFSFTGRWHRNRQVYSASAWPGTYVTSLVYGDKCIIKLKPRPKGFVYKYAFYVSVDGGKDKLYTLPPFESSEPKYETMFVAITMPKDSSEESSEGDESGPELASKRTLKPHTVRIMSVPETPFSFEGLLVTNTLIHQGMSWAEKQDERTYVEFVGEGVDAETHGGLLGWVEEKSSRQTPVKGEETFVTGGMKHEIKNGASLLNSVQHRVAEALGFRHTHVSTATCLVSKCNPANPMPGLAEQYFNEEPIPPDVTAEKLSAGTSAWRQSLQQQWPFTGRFPWVKSVAPSYVVVDLGVRDLLTRTTVDENVYERTLMVFLAKMRKNARPNAAIMVVARDPDHGPRLADSIIPDDHTTREARRALFRATKEAVEALRAEDPNIFLLPINPSRSPFMDLAAALCASMVEPFLPTTNSPSSDSSSEPLSPSKAQNLCRHIKAPQHRIIPIISSLEETLHNNFGGNKETKHLLPPHPHKHGVVGPSKSFIMMYAVALCVFAAVLAFLLARPILMMLGSMGVGVPGQKRVRGVRGDVESGGVVEFGMKKPKRGRDREREYHRDVMKEKLGE